MKRCAGSNRITNFETAPTLVGSKSIPFSIHCTAIRGSKRSCKKSLRQKHNGEDRQSLRRIKTPERYPFRGAISGRLMVTRAGGEHGAANVRRAGLVTAQRGDFARDRISSRTDLQLGLRDDAGGIET